MEGLLIETELIINAVTVAQPAVYRISSGARLARVFAAWKSQSSLDGERNIYARMSRAIASAILVALALALAFADSAAGSPGHAWLNVNGEFTDTRIVTALLSASLFPLARSAARNLSKASAPSTFALFDNIDVSAATLHIGTWRSGKRKENAARGRIWIPECLSRFQKWKFQNLLKIMSIEYPRKCNGRLTETKQNLLFRNRLNDVFHLNVSWNDFAFGFCRQFAVRLSRNQ